MYIFMYRHSLCTFYILFCQTIRCSQAEGSDEELENGAAGQEPAPQRRQGDPGASNISIRTPLEYSSYVVISLNLFIYIYIYTRIYIYILYIHTYIYIYTHTHPHHVNNRMKQPGVAHGWLILPKSLTCLKVQRLLSLPCWGTRWALTSFGIRICRAPLLDWHQMFPGWR